MADDHKQLAIFAIWFDPEEGAEADIPKKQAFAQDVINRLEAHLSKICDAATQLARPNYFRVVRTPRGEPSASSWDAESEGKKANVRYLLEGSLRQEDQTYHLSMQLVDTLNDPVPNNCPRKDLPALKLEIGVDDDEALDDAVSDIVTYIEMAIYDGEQARCWRESHPDPVAYGYYLQGREHWRQSMVREGWARAMDCYNKATQTDSKFSHGFYALATMHQFGAINGWDSTRTPDESLELSRELANQALELHSDCADAYVALSRYAQLKGRHEEALKLVQKAVRISPNGANPLAHLGRAKFFNGEHEEAVAILNRAIGLAQQNPPSWHLLYRGAAKLMAGQVESAIKDLQATVKGKQESVYGRVYLAAAYAALGDEKSINDARKEVQQLKPGKSKSEFNYDTWAPLAIPFANVSEDRGRLDGWLREAGLISP